MCLAACCPGRSLPSELARTCNNRKRGYRRAADRRARPQRWHDAVAELLALQAEYTAWADALPDTLRDTATAEALQAIVEVLWSCLEH